MDGESVEKCLSISRAHFQQEKMKVVKADTEDQESQKQAEELETDSVAQLMWQYSYSGRFTSKQNCLIR